MPINRSYRRGHVNLSRRDNGFPSEFRTAVVAAVGGTLMAAVVACAPGASTPSPSQPAGDHDAFTQCMTDNGVPAPPGVDQRTWDNATQACASLVPAPPERA